MEKYIENFKKSKLVVYTIITGNYDTLKEPDFIDDNCDYICFTDDNKLTSKIWKIQLIRNTGLDNIRFQRKYKVLPHKFLSEYEYSVYIDANVRIIGSIRTYVEKEWRGASLLGLKHPSRDNIYDEAEACINFQKDDPEIINNQIDRYKSEGYRADNGLTVTSIIFRKNKDEKLMKVMEDWWDEILNNSRRDQLSFCYVCWKNNFEFDVTELKCYRSDYWLSPGIHTDNIYEVEKELIDHIQLADYLQNILNEKNKCLALKKKEYENSLEQNERMFEIEIQKKDEILSKMRKEFKKNLVLKEEEYEKALEKKEQEFAILLANKEEYEQKMSIQIRELEGIIISREQELTQISNELVAKSKEVSDIKAQLEHIEHTLSWRYTALFRRIFSKH